MATPEYARWLLLRAYVHHTGRRVEKLTDIERKTQQRLCSGKPVHNIDALVAKLEPIVPERAEFRPVLPAPEPSQWHKLVQENQREKPQQDPADR